jgi:predicted TIM-barrel fold metal-dependent hydrolase
MSTRRDFVKTLAAGAILAQRGGLAGGPRTGRIDVHHHRTTVGGGGRTEWSPRRSLEEMDKYGIDVAITSVSAAGPALYEGTEKSNTFARASNEQGAKMVQEFPGRFGLFLALPMNDTQGTLKEIAYGYETLKADGVHIYRASAISGRAIRSTCRSMKSSTGARQ